ncbi:MAG: hypothetical protein ACM3U2_13110 [Deltaproteobacteria bacterium]
MRITIGRIAMTGLAAALLTASAFSDGQGHSTARKQGVPDISEQWCIRIEGYGGTPHDRSKSRVTLAADGTMHVGKSRRGSYHKAFAGKLSDEETRRFFTETGKVVKGCKPKTSTVRTEDGRNWTVEITSTNSTAEAKYAAYSSLADADPGFAELETIIEAHRKQGEHFSE